MRLDEPGAARGRLYTKELWGRLMKQALAEPDPADGYSIGEDVIRAAQDRFLPLTEESGQRSHVSYWRAHGEYVGNLMAAFAKKFRRNSLLYREVGVLHDADYHQHPHYGDADGPVHPAPLCGFLLDAGVSAVICLAILEHAGYTAEGKDFSSPMAAALAACDDLATFASSCKSPNVVAPLGFRPESRQLSALARELLASILSKAPTFPDSFQCPRRVLRNVDLYVNKSLALGADSMTGSFRL